MIKIFFENFCKGLNATAWLVKRPSDWLSVASQLVKFYEGLSDWVKG